MNKPYKVLIDSDAFLALFLPGDLLYKEATQALARLRADDARLVTTNLILYEVATVLSNRVNQTAAISFLQKVATTPLIYIDKPIADRGLELFKQQTGRGMSVVDCINAVLWQAGHVEQVFSFDVFYKRMGVKRVSSIPK